MKPKRPDSAKSRVTQKTLDTQLNQSKFSQTFTSYTTFQLQKKDEFEKYMQEKQKDPRFKKYYQPSTLPEIPQKQPKQQLQKINSKPFEKRISKVGSSKPKVQQTKQQISKKTNIDSSNQFTSNKSFAQKNKQKMNAISAGLKKVQTEQKKGSKRIDLKGFKVTVPGKKVNKTNQEQKQAQNQFIMQIKPQKTSQNILSSPQKPQQQSTKYQQTRQVKRKVQKSEQQLSREQQLLEISQFINEIEMKNVDYYPEGYEQFVQKNQSHTAEDLDKININDFLMQPTERDYKNMQKRITQNEMVLLNQQNLTESRMTIIKGNSTNSMSAQSSSIDLDAILDGQSQANQQNQNDSQIFLSSISSKDLKQRNLFLTQVLKGRVTKQQIQKLQKMDHSQIKMMKLQDNPKDQDDDIEIMEINMMKKKSNRLFEKNKIEAAGHIYRDCDYLSEQNKQRLQKLLNGEMDASPFQQTEWQRFAIRRIDEGIRLYRQFSRSYQNDKKEQVLNQDCLPKDPNLRKQAEKKTLKQKIDSINSRLKQIEQIVVNQTKIQALVQEHRTSKVLQTTQNIINERNQQIEQINQKSKLAEQMLCKAQNDKAQIQQILRQMQQQYKKYQKQCKQFQKMTVQQIKQAQMKTLKQQKNQIQQIQRDMQQLQRGTDQNMYNFHKEIQNQIQILTEIENMSNNNRILVPGFSQDQTVEGLDQIFNKKAVHTYEGNKINIGEEEKQNQEHY